jgi:hypothetical protein
MRRFLHKMVTAHPSFLSPSGAGIHPDGDECKLTRWIPAFAGMTGEQLPFHARSGAQHGTAPLLDELFVA